LEEYITKGNDYVDWLQKAVVEDLESFNGCSVNMHACP